MKKTALITGCSHGIGLETASLLLQAGYKVYAGLKDINSKHLLTEKLENKNCTLLEIVKLDITNRNDIQNVIGFIEQRENTLDVLINNAAAVILGPPDAATPDEIEWLFKTNVFGTINVTQSVIPLMREKCSGHIITIGSMLGIESSSFLGLYAATKFALEAIVASWAATLSHWNIKCTIIDPGGVNTNLINSVKTGSYYEKNDPYISFNNNALDFLRACLKEGQSPEKIANIILEVINSPNPDLRYSTCALSSSVIAYHLRDVTGNSWLASHRAFIEHWF